MRKHSLLVASTLALVAASSLAPSLAHAACTEPDGRCGDGAGHGIKYAHAAPSIVPGAVNFEWTTPTYDILIARARLRAGIELAFTRLVDPVKGGAQPLFSVDLDKAPVTATWSADTKRISIKRVEATADIARFDVRYTLAPQAYVAADTMNAQNVPTQLYRYNYLLNDIFSDTIGNPNFSIDGDGTKQFKPWAFTALTPFLVEGGGIPSVIDPNDTDSSLFTRPWKLGEDPANPWANGTFGVYVKSNAEFTYKTLSVKYDTTDLTEDTAVELPLQAEYGNSVKVPLKARGGVRIGGNIEAKPYFKIDQVYGIGPFLVETGFEQARRNINLPSTNTDEFIEFNFPADSEVVIPVPNVKIATTSAEFTGTVGGEGSGKVVIKNEGDAPAKVKFEKDGDFQLSSQGTEIAPGGSYELIVRAKPEAAGSVTGSVKVTTNDPDSPELSFNVDGKFTDPVIEDEDGTSSSGGKSSSSGGNNADGENTGDAAADDSGCGCKTAGTSATSSLGLFGSLALGLAAVIRRRRKN